MLSAHQCLTSVFRLMRRKMLKTKTEFCSSAAFRWKSFDSIKCVAHADYKLEIEISNWLIHECNGKCANEIDKTINILDTVSFMPSGFDKRQDCTGCITLKSVTAAAIPTIRLSPWTPGPIECKKIWLAITLEHLRSTPYSCPRSETCPVPTIYR